MLRCCHRWSRCWWFTWWRAGHRGFGWGQCAWVFPVSPIGSASAAQWDYPRSKFAWFQQTLCVWGCSPGPTTWPTQANHLQLPCGKSSMSRFGSFTQRRGFDGISLEPSEDVQATKRHCFSDDCGFSVFNTGTFSMYSYLTFFFASYTLHQWDFLVLVLRLST